MAEVWARMAEGGGGHARFSEGREWLGGARTAWGGAYGRGHARLRGGAHGRGLVGHQGVGAGRGVWGVCFFIISFGFFFA
jgi:hypothetical protein